MKITTSWGQRCDTLWEAGAFDYRGRRCLIVHSADRPFIFTARDPMTTMSLGSVTLEGLPEDAEIGWMDLFDDGLAMFHFRTGPFRRTGIVNVGEALRSGRELRWR